ncbi:acetyl-CoA carboxylase biotin carboxylase subunit [Actinomadura formosensis]|uniref:acetyl-CoA carboxylase biotin carboxylase subunit n=1 Tax=Actinomadura formosensis TaxID=60706 RepID=UPI000830FA62|nr:acetyl-CoA carboxylase biotin carboxylase subunit [Actinomadura formosensis]
MFDKILIANRGEIALRVVRACREMGVRSVAVYSTEDADSAPVRLADEAVRIGPAAAKRSYLNIPAIIEAAAMTGADAVHPGYGFLSEDPDFAEICEQEGLTFIGPPAGVLARLGDKSTARSLMSRAGLPLLPGTVEPLGDLDAARRAAGAVGFPVIVKAVAGGGGRGMHVADDEAGLAAAYARARSDAQAFFGDGRVYAERYLRTARHVEVQVLADAHGNVICLGERDCSVQRRNQKLIEETPAPALAAEMLAEMKRAALRGAAEVGYRGAGTFEFLVSPDGEFYFMEVNGRIQVEHPVTELATGIDLVQEQIRVAAGLPLRYAQDDVVPRGAVIECRINAEDPERGFAPAPGVLAEFTAPAGPFVRVDTHGFTGARISPSYDSLLAKVVVWAPDRGTAIARMRRALAEFAVSGRGVRTTREFLLRVLGDRRFAEAAHGTSLVADLLTEEAAEAGGG